MYLSKSIFRRGIQCPKMLWMDKNVKEFYPDWVEPEAPEKLETGINVGEQARLYYSDNPAVINRNDYEKNRNAEMINKTEELIAAGEKVICEASFKFESNFCSVDILRVMKNGYQIVEVKSSTDKEKDKKTGEVRKKTISDIDLYDMAYQYYVVTNAGYKVEKVFLMRLDSEYIFDGKIKLKKLFALDDCTKQVKALLKRMPADIIGMFAVSMLKEEPIYRVGNHCDKPQSCDYISCCWDKKDGMPHILDIGFRMTMDKKASMKYQGYSFEDILEKSDELKLSDLQQKQVDGIVNPDPKLKYYNKDGINTFLNGLTPPIYHLDFETFQQAVPDLIGVSPYQQIPFQYSLHYQDDIGEEIKHKGECLAKEGTDPRKEIATRLYNDLRDIGDGTILAYNMSFERTVLLSLADWFDNPKSDEETKDMVAFFRKIADKDAEYLKDLMDPFSAGYYYHTEMKGSVSIKYVLPAVLGYNPYDDLDLIKNGGDAMNTFPILHTKEQNEIDKYRKALIEYCVLDTKAMAWVLDALWKLVRT